MENELTVFNDYNNNNKTQDMNKCEVPFHPQQLTIKGDVVMPPKGHKWADWPIIYKSIMLCLIKNHV